MKVWILTQYFTLILVVISCAKAELRMFKDVNLIKDIVLTKIFGNLNEGKHRPIIVQENIFNSPESLLSVGKEEVKILIPKESEDSFKPEYTYKQIRGDGSAIVYKLNDKDEVVVTDTRNQQNPQDSSEYNRNRPAFSSFQAILKPSKPCKADSTYVPYNLNQPIVYSIPQTAPKIPEYSYKVIHKDGSVTTYFGTGEVQEQQLPDLSVNRFISNHASLVLNSIENAATGNPYVHNRRNLEIEEVGPVELVETERELPLYVLPRSETNPIPSEFVYIQPSVYNPPEKPKVEIVGIEYDNIDLESATKNLEDIFIKTTETTDTTESKKNNSKAEDNIAELVKKLAESPIPKDIMNTTTTVPIRTTVTIESSNKPSSTSRTTYSYKQINSDHTTLEIRSNDEDNVSVDVNDLKLKANGNSLGEGDRGDVPTSTN